MNCRTVIFFTIALMLFSFTWGPKGFASQDVTITETPPSPDAPTQKPSIAQEEEILIQSPKSSFKLPDNSSYFVTTGGSVPIYDEDFRDFLDYGVSVTVGVKREVMKKLSIQPAVGLVLMKGDWDMSQGNNIIFVESEEYFPGYSLDGNSPITAEDLPDENLGSSYHSDAEAIVVNAELLRNVDVDTSLYIVPLTFNAVYQLHEGNKRATPYIGGGLGFCVARREAESKVLKDRFFEGPEYRVTLNDSETVTGQIFQLFGGYKIPYKKNTNIVIELSTALYDLESFDPILEVAYKRPNPGWYPGSDLSSWTYEEPVRIGVFQEEFITSFTIGIVFP